MYYRLLQYFSYRIVFTFYGEIIMLLLQYITLVRMRRTHLCRVVVFTKSMMWSDFTGAQTPDYRRGYSVSVCNAFLIFCSRRQGGSHSSRWTQVDAKRDRVRDYSELIEKEYSFGRVGSWVVLDMWYPDLISTNSPNVDALSTGDALRFCIRTTKGLMRPVVVGGFSSVLDDSGQTIQRRNWGVQDIPFETSEVQWHFTRKDFNSWLNN